MNSRYSKLQLKLLSPSGELLNCINCYSGQVSVFRAASAAELRPYQRALAGVDGPERFSLTLDDESYRPEAHNLIGFGEQFLASDGTVASYLEKSGVPTASIDSILLSFGLENVCLTRCNLLSKCEERRVRILAATYSHDKVLVVNNPFDPISQEWRERFAELITNFARSQKQIVVIPMLSYRPECWIDNECVARIKVGENIQKTIGFGSGEEDVTALVQQVRHLFKGKDVLSEIIKSQTNDEGVVAAHVAASRPLVQPEDEARAHIEAQRASAPQSFSIALSNSPASHFLSNTPRVLLSRMSGALSKRNKLALSACAAALLLILAGGFFNAVLRGSRPVETASIVTQPEAPADLPHLEPIPAVPEISGQDSPDAIPVTSQAASQQQEPSGVVVTTALLLDKYPPRVKNAILSSLEGSIQADVPSRSGEEIRPYQPSSEISGKEAGEFLKLLEKASTGDSAIDVSDDVPQAGSASLEPPTNEQERREQIRQKFLEAIQRAQQRRAGAE
ncbi:MAG: hypothetical protein J5J00_17155 [Deltaproteobacteria bacterium]|nr:hypothetical protein [Deltaproteobacteria bacterium]